MEIVVNKTYKHAMCNIDLPKNRHFILQGRGRECNYQTVART